MLVQDPWKDLAAFVELLLDDDARCFFHHVEPLAAQGQERLALARAHTSGEHELAHGGRQPIFLL